MNKKVLKFSFILTIFSIHLQSQTTFFVAPRGNDSNSGTKEKPFASIEHAQLQARKIQDSVTIYLREGVYYLSNPITFNSSDSRSISHPLVLKNLGDERVTISGGLRLKPKWRPYKGGIYKARVPKHIKYDQLIVNGALQRMARYPDYDSAARFLGGTSEDAISRERATGWHSPAGGYVHALHKHLWGGFHYIITGKDKNGELILEGGWQNNRKMGMHDKHRFVENIFEELNTENEWFYDGKTSTLYFFPPQELDIESAIIEIPQISHLIEFKGSEDAPVSNIRIEGLTLTNTLRTFMETKESLLRSDWTIYRGGAILFEGATNCIVSNCVLTNLGGNAVFFNKYNRKCEVLGCLISEIGASGIAFVGDPNAVRSPSFEYKEFVPLNRMDRAPGPKTSNYPADCKIDNNLMFNLGLVEKQSAGVQISMSQSITVSHNTIYDVPRAGINISEGTWGGHIIEYNDVFNTVKETGDHGSFNSWGRDRYWHPDKKILDSIVANDFELTMLDVVKPIIIRNNRFRCDHGWDIDLDDGSSNYQIYNNLCLNGGIKLREGVNRRVENNIMINNSFHPHVWFRNSNDIFRRNIVTAAYKPIRITDWGKEVDFNLFPDLSSLETARSLGIDKNSVYGSPLFIDPGSGNFQVKEGSPAFEIGFENFSMDEFGVYSSNLKTIAKKVDIPEVKMLNKIAEDEFMDFMGARLKNLHTAGEQSATGMAEIIGILVVEVAANSEASKYLQPNDVILKVNGRKTDKLPDFHEARKAAIGPGLNLVIFRNQEEKEIRVSLR